MPHLRTPLLFACLSATLSLPAIAADRADAMAAAITDQALATSRNCMSCHSIDKKILGPAYKDIAAKYRGDKTAPAVLAAKIRQGGGGVWGVVKMPSNPQVTEAEAHKLAAWVLGQ